MTEARPLCSRADVARLLEVRLETLTYWAVALPPVKRYESFKIQRRGGGERIIHAPAKPLKDLQRRLATDLTERYDPPSRVHGFVPERSAVTNARTHRNREWVLRVDLADFFPSINFGRVRGLFMAWPFEFGEPAATLLAQICCFDGALPQGAPTSPIISNFICHGLDRDLAHLAWSERCSVTRYADDLCFSTDRTFFPHRLAYVDRGKTIAGEAVEDIVQGNGFQVNSAKSRLMRRTQRQRVTGLVVNETVNVSRNYVRDLRNLLYIWKRHGEPDAIEAWKRASGVRNWPPGKASPRFAQMVRGRVQHVGSVKGFTSSTYLKLAATLEELDENFVLRHKAPPPDPSEKRMVRLLTEGDTDILHILAAQRHFHRKGEFLDLELVADEEFDPGGDSKLLQRCEALATTMQPVPCVCLFDRDSDQALKRAIGPSGNWRNWGRGVTAVALVEPDGERACIETLYDQSAREIADEHGRRLFLMKEFNPRSGLHSSKLFSTPHPDKKKLVPESVFSVESGDSVGLTKADFAALIDTESGAFGKVSFESFRPTFEVIRQALAATVPSG